MIAQIQMRRGTTAEWAAASPVVLAAGEPGWDSTLEGMKVGDGSTEWAALSWIDAKNRPDINADTLDGVHLADIRRGQNILHNWDFRNPVNQRGVSGAISTGGYFYDRWILNSGTVTTNADYLTIGASAEIEQRIEGNLLAGETVTVSVMVGGTVFSGTGIMPTSGTASVTLTGWGTATLGYATGYMYVRLSPTAASNVVRVKAELGTVSTLAYDPPMDHAVELPKCQRFFYSLNNNAIAVPGYTGSTTFAYVTVATPVTMRIAPTFSGTTPTLRVEGSNYATTVSAVVLNNNMVRLNLAATGFPANDTVNAYLSNCEFSADL